MLFTLLTLLVAAEADPDAGVPETTAAPDAGVQEVADAGALPASPVLEALKNIKVSAAYGKGITVGNDELELSIRGRVQVLGQAQVPDGESKHERFNSLQIRRARLLITTKLPYHLSSRLQLAFANQDMEADQPNVLRDFFVEWRRFRDVSVRFGQFKVPFDVQRTVSSSSLQFADRAFVTGELNLDRDVGVILFSDDFLGLGDRLRYWAGVMGGDGRNRIGHNAGLLYVARVAVTPFGKIDDRVEGDPDREHRFRLAIGGAIARNVGTPRPRSTTGTPFTFATFDYTHATVDLHLKAWGFSLLAQGFLRDADQDSVLSADGTKTEWSRSGLGWFVQGGAYLTDWLELVARYGDQRPYASTDPKFVRVREMGGGINFMVLKHDLKLQLDYFWLDDGFFHEGRHLIRAQAQVFF